MGVNHSFSCSIVLVLVVCFGFKQRSSIFLSDAERISQEKEELKRNSKRKDREKNG
jgi:hypothetical protein